MHRSFFAAFGERQGPAAPPASQLSHTTSTVVRAVRYFILFCPVLFILGNCAAATETSPVPSAVVATYTPSAEQSVLYRASLLQDNLPAYLDFVSNSVLPQMSENIDEIVHDLSGLTGIRPGFFHHAHIDYSIVVPGELGALMDMNNVVLQYHTLETPLVYIAYWKEQLRPIGDPDINAWLDGTQAYNLAISTPSAASEAQYTPLTEARAVRFASIWDHYLRQNRLVSPGLQVLTNMIYIIDGGRQPRYQDAFRSIHRNHSVAFTPQGYFQVDNRPHLQNTFSPFQVTFEYASKCGELSALFEEAGALGYAYILNASNMYVARHAELVGDPVMDYLNRKLQAAIHELPDDNLIRISSASYDQQIAFFAVGGYIFAVYGSLDSPPVFQ